MFIEMIDSLRCVNSHEETWLVASFREVANRFVIEGTLGCPICAAEYLISDGVADFTLGAGTPDYAKERANAEHSREELATRAGAFLDATQPGATIVLGGLWSLGAAELAQMADVRIIALNPPAGVHESERVGVVRTAGRIPLAQSSAHGVALDEWFDAEIVEAARRVVKPGGRVVGPASFPHPADTTVLAHDDTYWVAEKPVEIIPLQRAKVT
jgi:hypothetical protein